MSAFLTLQKQITKLSGGRSAQTIHHGRRVEVFPRPDLSTDRVSFRPLVFADRGVFIDSLNRSRGSLRPWFPLESLGQNVDSYFEFLVEKGVSGDSKQNAWRRAGFLNDGRFLGMFNIIKIERGLDWTGEANWWIDQDLAGMGYGSHACQAVVDHALSDIPIGLGLHSLKGSISAENHASMRIAKKLGFEETGEQEILEINSEMVPHKLLICNAIIE